MGKTQVEAAHEGADVKEHSRVEHFGESAAGGPVRRFVLEASNGLKAEFIEYGASLISLQIPVHGVLRELVLGCDTLGDYEEQEVYLGALVGRCANRIYRGQLMLPDALHCLDLNHGAHHLHGGDDGFSHQVWSGGLRSDERGPSVRFGYVSRAGEGGYPGRLDVHVDYTLDGLGRLCVEYEARTDALTAVNLTQHAYFNLAADHAEGCRRHRVRIEAERFLETDADGLPTGRILNVEGSALDLRDWRSMSGALGSSDALIRRASGYDHTLLIGEAGKGFREFAFVESPDARVVMAVATDQPSLQFYTGNFLGGTPARAGALYDDYAGFCLEAQGLPDATRHASFPNALLQPGEVYRQCTYYRFAAS